MGPKYGSSDPSSWVGRDIKRRLDKAEAGLARAQGRIKALQLSYAALAKTVQLHQDFVLHGNEPMQPPPPLEASPLKGRSPRKGTRQTRMD